MKLPYKFICEICGKPFERPYKKESTRFCSKQCHWKDESYRTKMVMVVKKLNAHPTEKLLMMRHKYGTFPKKGKHFSPNTEFKKGWNLTKEGKTMLKRRAKIISIRPSVPEKIFRELLKKNEIPFDYVGDGKILVGSKNPDFINVSAKKIIEVFSDYWHRPDIVKYWHQTEQGTIDYYSQLGYQTLVVWEGDLLKNEENVLKNVVDFQNA